MSCRLDDPTGRFALLTENPMSKRVLLAGLFHETHTFLNETTRLADFQVRHGDELFAARGDGSPLAGALEVADQAGWDVVPIIDLRATPSGTVEDGVIDVFWDAFRTAAEREIPRGIDGICLILHGAMVSETIPDVEGELISRIRKLPGAADVPICGVLDLHGNISQAMAERTEGLIAYRTNPHIDAQAAAMDGARHLDRIMTSGRRPVTVFEHPPILWPPTGTGTDDDPMRTLEAMAREIERDAADIAAVNVFAGFSFADTPDTGMSFTAVTFGDPDIVRGHLRRLAAWAVEHRESGNRIDPRLEEVMPMIQREAASGAGPILIVEPADNIGGGAPGDATTILRALLKYRIDNAAVVINDPETVEQLESIDLRGRMRVAIGGKRSELTEGPVELDVELLHRSDGRFELEDRNSHLASMSGIHIDMGRCAVVRAGGVRILLTSRKTPPFDLGQLRSQGIVPEELSVIGVKAAVAHRRAYDKIARASYTVTTPGPCTSDVTQFPYRLLRRPIYPLDSNC